MSAASQKISWARRAISELEKAEANASREDFQYHFGAFLALIGALRQFITVKPHKQWVYSMDGKDLHYCSCIDLRNVDVHIENVVGTPRSEFDVQIRETLPPVRDSVDAVVTKAGEKQQQRPVPSSEAPEPSKSHGHTETSTTARFYVNPDLLPADFAVLKAARPTKPAEEALLRSTPAVVVARKALDFFENIILPDAVKQGVPIP